MILKSLAAAAAILCAGTLVAQPITSPPKPTTKATIGEPAPAFTLTDIDGKTHNLSDYKGKTVVLEWFNAGCPWSGRDSAQSVHATGRVKKLIAAAKKTHADVVYLLIDSSADRTKETIIEQDKAAREQFEIKQPMLVDHDGTVGRLYGARTTPHMFVIDGEGVLRYSGSFGDKRAKEDGSENNFVLVALEKLKAGEPVEPGRTRPWGCGVKYKR